jgi:hypothetical protein
MERTGTAIAAMRGELADLKGLLAGDTELVTVWANRPGPTPAAIDARVRAELTATPATRTGRLGAELGEALAGTLRAAEAGVVVASDRVLLAEPLDEPLRREATFHGPLPALSPVIEARQRDIPAVVVRLDRRGADIAWTAHGAADTMTIETGEHFITKVNAGGWSHATYHRVAENSWEHTATEAAAALERLDATIGARIVLLAADVRMAELLRRHVPPQLQAKLHDVTGARTADGSDDQRDEEIERWLRTAVAEDTTAALRTYDERRQRSSPLAVGGAAETFAALRAARADAVLVSDAARSEPVAYFDAAEATAIGIAEADMARARAPRVARRCDVAIRAALLSGAGVRVVPRGQRLDDGLGALLRWPAR